MKSIQKILLLYIIAGISVSGCKTQKDSLVEPQKDLSGNWRITNIVRNNKDITQWVDSSGFRLVLLSDGNFELQNNNIPFIVNSNGTWAADDPLYPFHLSFKATDSTDTKTTDIITPVINGNRDIEITFSPGCIQNTYVYTFTKMND